MTQLSSSQLGLSSQEALRRQRGLGNHPLRKRDHSAIWLLLGQFKSPITIILIFAALLSFFLRDAVDAIIILSIIVVSALLGFWQEYAAAGALKKLLSLVTTKATVRRDGRVQSLPISEIVAGDVVTLSAGGSIPADCLVIESRDLYVNEAALTGETYPVDKSPGVFPLETPLAERKNALFQGTHVVSGTAQALVIHTGDLTSIASWTSHRMTTLSSLFDFLTFAVLLWVLKANVEQFRTGWFLNSVVSASLVVLIVRTRRPIWHSSRPLLFATVAVATSLPWWPFARDLEFAPLPLWMIGAISLIVTAYVASAELAKVVFYGRMKRQPLQLSARHRISNRTSE